MRPLTQLSFLALVPLLLAGKCKETEGPLDADGDGVPVSEDCDDENPWVYPNSHEPEIPGDGNDQDCDGHDACMDLNCDSYPDLVFANTLDDSGNYLIKSYVYYGGEDGFSEDNRDELSTRGAMGVDIADLDGDGYLELVFSNASDGSSRKINSVIYWGGDLGFDATNVTNLPTVGAADVTIADVDKDDDLDLVFANRYNGEDTTSDSYTIKSYIYWNDGGAFSEGNRTDIPTIGAARALVADFNKDGLNDLVFPHGTAYTSTSYLYYGDGAGWPAETRQTLSTTFAEGAEAADFDKDGYLDLFFANWCGSARCDSPIYWGSEAGFSDEDQSVLETLGATDGKAADVDGDGYLDLLVVNSFEGGSAETNSMLFWGSSSGFDDDDAVLLPSVGGSEGAIADFNEDGELDIAIASFYGTEGAPAESHIYWGPSFSLRVALPTIAAAGVAVTPDVKAR